MGQVVKIEASILEKIVAVAERIAQSKKNAELVVKNLHTCSISNLKL